MPPPLPPPPPPPSRLCLTALPPISHLDSTAKRLRAVAKCSTQLEILLANYDEHTAGTPMPAVAPLAGHAEMAIMVFDYWVSSGMADEGDPDRSAPHVSLHRELDNLRDGLQRRVTRLESTSGSGSGRIAKCDADDFKTAQSNSTVAFECMQLVRRCIVDLAVQRLSKDLASVPTLDEFSSDLNDAHRTVMFAAGLAVAKSGCPTPDYYARRLLLLSARSFSEQVAAATYEVRLYLRYGNPSALDKAELRDESLHEAILKQLQGMPLRDVRSAFADTLPGSAASFALHLAANGAQCSSTKGKRYPRGHPKEKLKVKPLLDPRWLRPGHNRLIAALLATTTPADWDSCPPLPVDTLASCYAAWALRSPSTRRSPDVSLSCFVGHLVAEDAHSAGQPRAAVERVRSVHAYFVRSTLEPLMCRDVAEVILEFVLGDVCVLDIE